MPKLLHEVVPMHITCTHSLCNYEKPPGLPVLSQKFLVGTEVYRGHVADLMQRSLVGTEVYRGHVIDLMLKYEMRRQFSLGFTLLLESSYLGKVARFL